MASLTTARVNTNVKISWTAPFANALPITEYKILIKNSAGNAYFTETTYCNGADATIIALRECFIPLSVLRASPFNLVQGQLVIAVA
jgi:hypothetical protein